MFTARVSQNHYQTLGVLPNATAAEIKRAYRQLAVRYHPDKHGGDIRFEDKFKAVAVAYGVVGDAGRRATYDFQLTQAARRLEEQRRAQQYRPASQHVYGVPMPPPAPLRTRPPAGSRERHYQPIRRQAHFTRRDWTVTLLLLLGIGLFTFTLKVTMDRFTASSNYRDGLRAYANGQWAAALSFMDEALQFRPNYGPALRRRGELQMLFNHNPQAARTDFRAALEHARDNRDAADLLYRLGRCEAELGHPVAAEQSFTRALALDSTLSGAYLARGETRLLDLLQVPQAVHDLNHGLRLRGLATKAIPWRYVQVRGVAFAALGRFDDARADYFRVLQAWPQEGSTHFLLGCLATRSGDSAAACEFYRLAVLLGYEYAQTAEQKCR